MKKILINEYKVKYPYLAKTDEFFIYINEAKETPNEEIYLSIMEKAAKRRHKDFPNIKKDLSRFMQKNDNEEIYLYVAEDETYSIFTRYIRVIITDFGFVDIDVYTYKCFYEQGRIKKFDKIAEIFYMSKLETNVIPKYEYKGKFYLNDKEEEYNATAV